MHSGGSGSGSGSGSGGGEEREELLLVKEVLTESALWAAATAHGNVTCVRLLLSYGAATKLPGDTLEARMAHALQRGLLLSPSMAADLSIPCPLVNSRGQTALLIAVRAENEEAARVLLQARLWMQMEEEGKEEATVSPGGVDANHYVDLASTGEPGPGASPLYVAICREHPGLVEALLTLGGASPKLIGQVKGERWPRTPLSRACALGSLECVGALLRSSEGISTVNMCAAHRRTPLMEAVWHNHPRTVGLLLATGAVDLTLANEDGATALHAASYWGRHRGGGGVSAPASAAAAAEKGRADSILGMLLAQCRRSSLQQPQDTPSNSSVIDLVDNDGCTALCHAASALGDQDEWVNALLHEGACPSGAGYPCGGYHARGLLACWEDGGGGGNGGGGGSIDGQPWGSRPVEEAATRGHVKVVATLLHHAANTTAAAAAARASEEEVDVSDDNNASVARGMPSAHIWQRARRMIKAVTSAGPEAALQAVHDALELSERSILLGGGEGKEEEAKASQPRYAVELAAVPPRACLAPQASQTTHTISPPPILINSSPNRASPSLVATGTLSPSPALSPSVISPLLGPENHSNPGSNPLLPRRAASWPPPLTQPLEPPAITHNAARSHQLLYGNKTSAPSASPPVSPLLTAAARSTLIGAFEGVDLDEESGGTTSGAASSGGATAPSGTSLLFRPRDAK